MSKLHFFNARKKQLYLVLIFFMIYSVSSCTSVISNAKTLDATIYERLTKVCGIAEEIDVIVFYFDADCALCVAQIIDLEKSVTDEEVILIAKSTDPEIFEYNIQKLNIKSCVIIEKDHAYRKYFTLNEKVKINKDRVVTIWTK